MVKSLLSPEKIIGNKNPKSPFGSLSGKNSLGSSVISKSSNKIVGFNRAKVSTNKGEVQKIVSNLTTNNIANSSNNIVKNIFGSLQAKQNKEEENKEKKFGIFGFFNSIKDAFNLIRFVGSKKNLDKIKDSLENLKITFSETFDTAKILRKIIKKIFDQLSGLSGDGGGGKGLWGLIAAAIAGIIRKLFRGVVKTFSDIFARMSKNENTMRDIIDKISPPPTPQPSAPSIGTAATTVGGMATGSGLASLPAARTATKALPAAGSATKALPAAGSATKALPAAKGFSKIPKKGKFGLIAAGLGLATLGGSAMMNKSGLSQPGGEDVQPGDTAPEVPGNVLDRFNSILDRFDKILDGLKGKPGKSSGGSSSSGSSSKPASPGAPSGGSPSPGGAPSGVTIKDDKQGLSELGITQEQFNAYKQGIADVEGARYNQMGGAGGRFAGRYQMGSGEIASASAVMGIPNPSQQEYLSNPELQEKIYMGRTILMNRRMMQLSPEYKSMSATERLSNLAGAQLGEGSLTDFLKGKKISDSAGVEIQRWINSAKRRMGQVAAGKPIPQAPTKPGQQAPQAPSSSKPGPQPIQVIPFESPSSQVQPASSGGGGKISAPPSPQQNGPTAPFYPSSNYDNFLTLYSRMVYNIVDG
jgi:hypothetical protein